MHGEEPPTQRAVPVSTPKKAVQGVTDTLAALIGIGVILAGVVVVLEDGPVGSGLMLFIAGLVLLPYVPVPGRGSRTVIFILALGVALVTPMWKSFVVHRQTQAAFRFATEVAARLTETSAKDGRWPRDAVAFPEKLEPVEGDGWSHDVAIRDCGGERCTLIVTLKDWDYDTSIRSRSFALSTLDGGKTWTCHPTGGYHVRPVDLPAACREGN